jgi:hypothetical protein
MSTYYFKSWKTGKIIEVDDPKDCMKKEFKCPLCGSNKHGDSFQSGKIKGQCHGCFLFTWIRNDKEDAKVFVDKNI